MSTAALPDATSATAWPSSRHGVVVVLLADRVRRDEDLVARGQGVLRGHVGLRLRERCLGRIQCRDVRRRIDLVEPLARLHFRAFCEFTTQHDAVDPCTNLRDEECARAARQFADDRNGGRLDGDDADFGRLGRRCCWFLSAGCRITAAVAALIKRNGTRSTRMERPLSKTEIEINKCAAAFYGRAATSVLRRLPVADGRNKPVPQPSLRPLRLEPSLRTAAADNGLGRATRTDGGLKAVSDINRSMLLGLSLDGWYCIYIHERT